MPVRFGVKQSSALPPPREHFLGGGTPDDMRPGQ
jgi:hypothetical protein